MNWKIGMPWALAIVAIGWALLAQKCASNNKQNLDGQVAYDKSIKDTVNYFTGKYGIIVAQKQAVELSNQTLQQVLADKTNALTQALANMKIKPANVQTVAQIVDNTSIGIKPHDSIIIKHDTIAPHKSVALKDSNRYYCITGVETETQTTLHFKLTPDTLTFVNAKVKGSIFGATHLEALVQHSNPYTTTSQIESLSIIPQKRLIDSFWLHFIMGAIVAALAIHYL